MGLGVGLPLLQWLDKYTFPFESRFSDLGFAKEMYEAACARHLRHGTTFCSYFATIHVEATKELTRIARDMGQRVYVGKVNMDRNGYVRSRITDDRVCPVNFNTHTQCSQG